MIRVTVDDGNNQSAIFTTTADGAGSWTLTLGDVQGQLAIEHGENLTVNVSATDRVNNVTTLQTATWSVDAETAPIALSIDDEDRDPDSGGAFSINATAGISGSTEADAVVRITVDDGTESAIFTTTADGAGSWTLTLGDVTNQLTIDHDETLTVNVSATDGVNNITTMQTVTWSVDSVADDVSLSIDGYDRDPDITDPYSINATAGISGSTEANAVVRLTVVDQSGEQAVFTSTADAAGSWTLTLGDVQGQLTIDHNEALTITSTVTDLLGNETDQNLGTWSVDAQSAPIALGIDDEDQDAGGGSFSINATAGIYGSAEAEAVIRVTVDDGNNQSAIFTTTADGAGSWTLTLGDVQGQLAIEHGENLTVNVSATDRVNNVTTLQTATWSVDAETAPIALSIDDEDRDPDSGGAFSINATAGISGSTEADAVVRITVNDGTESAIFTTTADGAGSWTLTLGDVTNQLTIDHDETLTVNVSATDGVNNITTMQTVTWSVDSVADDVSLSIDGYDRDPDQTDPYSINATAGISGSTEAHAVVRLTVSDGSELAVFTSTADAAGSWTLTLGDVQGQLTIDHNEALTITSTVTDLLGNETDQNLGTWSVDAKSAPIALGIDDEDQDAGGGSFSINATAGIYGSAEAEAVIRVTVDDGNNQSAIFTTTADGAGSWTLTLGDVQGQLAIEHGENLTVNVSATDRVNNVTTLQTATWSVDAETAPIALSIDEEDRDPDSGGAFSINATAGISGSTEAEAVVRITVSDTTGGGSSTFTTTADGAGSWTLTLGDAGGLVIDHDDELNVTVSATDGVNNVTTLPAQVWKVDSVAQDITLSIDADDRDPDGGGAFSINATAGISGSAEAGAVVRLTVSDGSEFAVFTSTADAAGSWTLTLGDVTNQLTIDHDDRLTVTSTVTDVLGNETTNQDFVTWTVDSVAPDFFEPAVVGSVVAFDFNTVLSVDIDQDGDIDLVTGGASAGTQVVVYVNDNNPQETANYAMNALQLGSAQVLDIAAGDIDSDGQVDLLLQYAGSIDFLTDGLAAQSTAVSTVSTAVELVDYDNDGDLDMVTGSANNTSGGEVVYYENDGYGNFSLAGEVEIGGDVHDLHSFDLTGSDDASDLLVASSSGVYLLVGDETTGTPTRLQLSSDTDYVAVSSSDIDGSGSVDVIAGSDSGEVLVLTDVDETGASQGATVLTSNRGYETQDLGVIDYNGDGVSDIVQVTSNGTNSEIIVWMTSSDGSVIGDSQVVLYDGTEIYDAVDVYDYNNDGIDDLVFIGDARDSFVQLLGGAGLEADNRGAGLTDVKDFNIINAETQTATLRIYVDPATFSSGDTITVSYGGTVLDTIDYSSATRSGDYVLFTLDSSDLAQLNEGTNQLTVTMSDRINADSQYFFEVEKDTTAPDATVDVLLANETIDNVITLTTRDLSGTASGAEYVLVTVHDDATPNRDTAATGTFKVMVDPSAGDAWTLDLDKAIPYAGSSITLEDLDRITVSATAYDEFGNVSSPSTPTTYDVTSAVPFSTITIHDSERDPDGSPTFSISTVPLMFGTSTAMATVYVTLDDGNNAHVFDTVANSLGEWTIDVDGLSTGSLVIDHEDELTVSISARSTFGFTWSEPNTQTWTVDGATDSPIITIDDEHIDTHSSGAFSITQSASFSGSAEAHAVIRVTVAETTDGDLTTFTTTADAAGSWTLTLGDVAGELVIDHGDELEVTISATDILNNTSTNPTEIWSVDTEAYISPLEVDEEDRDPDSGGAFSINSSAGVSGTVEHDAVVRITVTDSSPGGGSATFTTTADAAGSWTLTLGDSGSLVIDHKDELVIQVDSTDVLGNRTRNSPVTWTVDSVAHPITLSVDDEDHYAGGGTFSINASAGIYGSAEAGSVIRLTVVDQTAEKAVFTSTADAAGSWTLTLGDVQGQLTIDHMDQLTVTSTMTDALGNEVDQNLGTWTVDAKTDSPLLSIDDEDRDPDSGGAFSINATAGISGSAEARAVIRITVSDDPADGGLATFTTTADAAGSWTLTLGDVAGELTIDHNDKLTLTVSATDILDNTTTNAPLTWTVDTQAYISDLTVDEEDRDPDSGGTFSINATAGISGTVEHDAVVRITVSDGSPTGGVAVFTTTADSAGSWTLTLGDVGSQLVIDHNDALTIQVGSTDVLGNTSYNSPVTWSVDSVADDVSLSIDGYDRDPDQTAPYSINATAGISGSTEANAVVRLTVSDGSELAVFTSTADAAGSWTLTLGDVQGQLTIDHNEALTITSTVTDLLGNETDQNLGTWSVDAKSAPIALGIDDEDQDAGGGSFSINATAGISGSAEAEAVIRVTVDDGNNQSAIFTTTADGAGSWTLTLGDVQGQLAIEHGENLTVNVSATDRVNNVTTLQTATWSVDAETAPIALDIDEEDRDPDSGGAFLNQCDSRDFGQHRS